MKTKLCIKMGQNVGLRGRRALVTTALRLTRADVRIGGLIHVAGIHGADIRFANLVADGRCSPQSLERENESMIQVTETL